MKKLIVKLIKTVFTVVLLAVIGLLVAAVCVINPWNTPAIFKRNYPEWFAAHPILDKMVDIW